MKKSLLTIALVLIANSTFAQAAETPQKENGGHASVEKSIFGIQTGLVGLWAYNECRLSNKIALRSEIGVDLGVVTVQVYTYNSTQERSYYLILPNISLEPRLYYNLDKRNARGKNVDNNSGNFFSVRINYLSGNYLNSTNVKLLVADQLGIAAEWGLRRVYGEHFTFETGFGLGPMLYFGNSLAAKGEDVRADIRLRIGYSF